MVDRRPGWVRVGFRSADPHKVPLALWVPKEWEAELLTYEHVCAAFRQGWIEISHRVGKDTELEATLAPGMTLAEVRDACVALELATQQGSA